MECSVSGKFSGSGRLVWVAILTTAAGSCTPDSHVAQVTPLGAGDSAGDGPVGDGGGECWDQAPAVVTVTPQYPLHGAGWNDYVKNDGADVFSASDTACTGAETGGYSACLHGGERRVVVLETRCDCNSLSIRDSTEAFVWSCARNNDDGTVVFQSTELAEGKGLADLIDSGSFRSMHVTIFSGVHTVATSSPAVWWSNPVQSLPDNANGQAVALTSPGTIYYLASSRGTAGYNIDADQIAVVTLAGAVLRYSGAAGNCDPDTAEMGTGDQCLIAAGQQKFLWLEGSFDGQGLGAKGLLGVALFFSRIRQFSVSHASNMGLVLTEADNNLAEAVVLSEITGHSGLVLVQSSLDTFRGLEVGNTGDGGITVGGPSQGLVFEKVWTHHNVGHGVVLWNSQIEDVSLTDIRAEANGEDGLHLTANNVRAIGVAAHQNGESGIEFSGDDSILSDISTSHNASRGVSVSGSSRNQLRKILSVNDALGYPSSGLCFYDSTKNVVRNLAVFNGFHGLRFYGSSSGNVVSQALLVGLDRWGVYLQEHVSGNTFSHITVVNTGAVAASSRSGTLFVGSANTINNLLVVNSAASGVYVDSPSSNNLWCNILSSHHGRSDVLLSNSNNNRFIGQLWLGPHGVATCEVVGGTSPGLIDETCTDSGAEGSSTYTGQVSDAVLHLEWDVSDSFVGKVTSDATNQSASVGQAVYDGITDWLDFDNSFRGWGLDEGAFPSESHGRRCGSGETCRIWDWRVRQSDSRVRGAVGAFVPAAACPEAAHGDRVLTDNQGNTFLAAAWELLSDSVGDDDGLCESNERCLFTPNLGAYQGEGAISDDSCQFVDGVVQGVLLYGFSVNGAANP